MNCQKCGGLGWNPENGNEENPIQINCQFCNGTGEELSVGHGQVDPLKDDHFPEASKMVFGTLQHIIHENAVAHGWWENERSFGEIIALCHSELSEALEAGRHGNKPSDHIPEFTGVEEELADCMIRIFDYAAKNNLRLAEALLAKHAFNKTRPYKHGKEF